MPEVEPGDERAALVEAMARSCAERGFAATTVELLTAEAGCSREDFFRHFDDLEDCALAAVEVILAEAMAAVASSYSADHSEWESALASLKSLLELFSRRPAFARLAFIDSRQAMPARANDRYRSGFAILNAMLDRLRSTGSGEAEAPPGAARAAIGGGEALVRRELSAGRAEGLPRILPDLVYSATVPFLGQPEALRLTREARQAIQPHGNY